MAIFQNEAESEIFRGVAGEYNQLNMSGDISDYTVVQRANGSITLTSAAFGNDRAFDMDGFWFGDMGRWYSLEDLLDMQTTRTGYLTSDGVRAGNIGNNALRGTTANDTFYGGIGNDLILGNGGDYNQVNYDGSLVEYSFILTNTGNLIVKHPTWGRDVLRDIDGLWFGEEGMWYSIDDAISLTVGLPRFRVDASGQLNGTMGNDRMIGTSADDYFYGGVGDDFFNGKTGFDQVSFDGYASDFTMEIVDNRSITLTHDIWGTDTLRNIDGVWFGDEGQWYDMDSLRDMATDTDPDPDVGTGVLINDIITGTNEVDDLLLGDATDNTFYAGRGNDRIVGEDGQDTLNVDGDLIEWTFTENTDGTVVMTHPTWGENTLEGIESILYGRSGLTYSVADSISMTEGLPEFRLDNDNVLNGTNGNDQMIGTAASESFYGGLGNDFYDGLGPDFDQLNYDGLSSEYNFTQNNDGSITASHPIWGTDNFVNIEGLFFNGGDGEFILVADLFA